jgi:hypothetical protein
MEATPAFDTHQLGAIVRRHLPAASYRVVLFGSRARGAARRGSDWDIGVLGPAPIRGAVLQRIRDDLEHLPTLAAFDVVDLSTVPPAFRESVLQEAVDLE